MAATYGYGGEFSSDEDIDKMEQQSERLVQSKFDTYAQMKPTKYQIEEAIETIRHMPLDQDVNLTDELLAGLLDHYKTQRGPIVDSTRNLYKKIILRLVHGDQQQQQQQQASNGDSAKDSNGNQLNNNNIALVNKKKLKEPEHSSDEDEPMPPASSHTDGDKKKFDSRVVYTDRTIQPMEVDSETPIGSIRTSKPVDSSSSEDDSETEESSTEDTSDSEVLDVTPVKPPTQVVVPKAAGPIPPASKSSEAVKKQPVAVTPIPKGAAVPKKKPYTRSQRVVTTRSGSSIKDKKTDVSSSRVEAVVSDGVQPLSKNARSSKFKVRYVISALLVAALAFFLYYFRSDLKKSIPDRILSRAINF